MASFPTVMSSIGAPLGASPSKTTVAPTIPTASTSRSAFITNLLPSEVSTVTLPSIPTSASLPDITQVTTSSLAPLPPTQAASNTSDNSSNTQNFPIGLIAGIVTGFSILILVMGVMFCLLWRHKRIRVVSDDEATEMRDQRSAMRAYYMPQPPSQQQQKTMAIGDASASPVKSMRAPPEVVTPKRVATSSPRRSSSADTNKPWPAMPMSTVYRTSASPLRDAYSNGARAINHPDPLRANWPIGPAPDTHTVHFAPGNHAAPLILSQAAIRQSHQLSPVHDCDPDNCDDTTNNSNQQRNSALSRTPSLAQHFALSPPPRRRPRSETISEVATNDDGGRVGETPGVRLSGCGTADEGVKAEETHSPERTTWCVKKKNTDVRMVSETPASLERRRSSQ